MGLTYTLTGKTSVTLPMTTRSIDQLERLRLQTVGNHVDVLFGTADQQAGNPFLIECNNATAALGILIPSAKKIPKGFEVWPPSRFGEVRDSGGRGVGGLLINGVYHAIWCIDDYWVIQPSTVTDIQKLPKYYEPRDITTENHGVYRVKQKKGRSDIDVLLGKIEKFIESDASPTFHAVFG